MIIDAGEIGPSYLPGHSHCDTLSFELMADEIPIIVDTGVSTYEIGARRQLERSTASHNTVQVGNLEQSEIWAGFRVGRRAKIIERTVSSQAVCAAHNGYENIGIVHRRCFKIIDKGFEIADRLEGAGRGKHASVARLHFSPGTEIRAGASEISAGPVAIEFEGATKIVLEQYLRGGEFNRTFPATVAVVSFEDNLLSRLRS
jgi:uncharacterized heparinase superfamily protein